jgi:tRNA(Ile)-lysidine synthase
MQNPSHHSYSMLSRIVAFIEQYSLLPDTGVVVVAVSGGADSLCLLHLLRILCCSSAIPVPISGYAAIPTAPLKRYPGVQLHVAHLNHQLRGEQSAAEAEQVAQLAHSWGLPVTIGSVDVPALAQREGRSLEDAARTARYRFLREVAQGQPVAVAHHQDDQVETLLLHFLRGGGIQSMIGLQPRQQDIIRPLLDVTHAETLDYCRQYELTPIEDESNNDTRFLRNRIRHELLPLLEQMNPGFRSTLLRTAEVMSVDAGWIATQIEQHWSTIASVEPDAISLSVEALNALPLSLQRHMLRRATSLLSDGQSPLELRHYQLIERLMQRPTSIRNVLLHLPNSLLVRREGDTIRFERWQPSQEVMAVEQRSQAVEIYVPVPGSVAVPTTPWIASAEHVPDDTMNSLREALREERWDVVLSVLQPTAYSVYIDADTIGEDGLFVRLRQPGDRMQPLGMTNEKKLQDIFIDRHIPREERALLPLFLSDERPVWLGGVILDERARLRKETQRIVRLQLQR